jgi:hypothetical protein
MTQPSVLARPVRTFRDPVTGATVHQLTEGPEPSVKLYFTKSSWLAGGKYLVLLRQIQDSWNFFAAGADGELRPVTRYPATPHPQRFLGTLHRIFLASELERMSFMCPATHPTRPWIAFVWNREMHLLDVERGQDEVVFRFPESELDLHSPVGMHFTADGLDVILVTARRLGPDAPRLDPPDQAWFDFLKIQEWTYVSKLWRFPLASRTLHDPIFASNGFNGHPLTCPWDPDLIFWCNGLHQTEYTMRRDGTGLRTYFKADQRHCLHHYSWDSTRRRLSTLVASRFGDPDDHAFLDLETGELKVLPCARGRCGLHQNVSPDGRWIVQDAPQAPVGDDNGLNLIAVEADRMDPLCQLRCSWHPKFKDEQGRYVKSETLHPNPSWSPDGRYVLAHSDFGTGVAQVYAVDVSTWRPAGAGG